MSLIILRGISCSGKSFIAKKYPNNVVSSDALRVRLFGTDNISPSASGAVWKEFNREIEYRAKYQMFTIVDATHTSKKSVKTVVDICKKYGCTYHIVDITPNVKHSIEWQEKRNRGDVCGVKMELDVIHHQYERYNENTHSIKAAYGANYFNGSLKQCAEFIECYVNSINHDVVYGDVFVIGDIHAQKEHMVELLSKIPQNSAIYTVGDMIDRGDDNVGTITTIMNDPRFQGFAMGNHELAFIHERMGLKECNSNARKKTHEELDLYKKSTQEKVMDFLKTGKSYIVLEHAEHHKKVLISHAGVEHFNPLSVNLHHTIGDRINGLTSGGECDMRQVHGHRSWEYTGDFSGKVVNVDSGCYDTGVLTAFNPFTDEVIHVSKKSNI